MKTDRHPYTKKDFDWVKWTSKDMQKVADTVVRLKKERYEVIKAIPKEKRTFQNTIVALEKADDDLADMSAKIGIHKDANPNAAIRAAAGAASEFLSKTLVEIEFDRGMYRALQEYAAKKEQLSGEDKLLFEDTWKGYKRMGFSLPKTTQARLKNNLKKLGKLGIAFDKNLNEYKDHIVVTRKELDGLPESYISNLRRDKKGSYKVTLAYPEYLPFMAGAHNAAKRKELLEKKTRQGGMKNVLIIKKMIRLRAENAKLLGYKNHVDYKLELRMAKSAQKVRRFLNTLLTKTRKGAYEDLQMLKAFKRKHTKTPKARLEAHDISYLFKQLRKNTYAIDGDLVKEHFPFEHVKQASLDAYQTLLKVRFERRTDISLWHKDVQLYDVYDPKTGYLSSFALDLFPRDGKYGHAAVFDIVMGRHNKDRYTPPLCAMIANFPKPSVTNPSLLSHGEVETFFHEFGHMMHFTLTKAKYRSQSGTNTAWDFVEAPSQMLENWVWDEGMLTKLSKHYKTGAPLPKPLIRNMIKAKLLGEVWSVRSQIALSLFDHLLHTGEAKDPVALYAKLERTLVGVPPPKDQLFIAGFGHLAHGYDAGYYGYLWSRVYAEDMFTRFKRAGILNSKVGSEYRSWILEKGSSMEEADLLKGFLRRKPDTKAFLKSIGVQY